MAYTSLGGQAYNDAYSKQVFSYFVDEEFSYKIVFYSGFTVFAGSIVGGICIHKFPRQYFILGAFMAQTICMFGLSLSFYFEWVTFAVVCNLSYSFMLYFG